MKKNNIIICTLLVLSLFETLNASKTEVVFSAPYNISEDKYGTKIVYQDVDIKKASHSINNFWSKFSNPNAKTTTYKNINTKGTFELTIEQSFTCQDGGLISEGCSGQKPFLINEGVLTNTALQVDANDNALPAGEYRIPYDTAANFNSSNNDAFYSLDVFRDMEYYKKPVAGSDSSGKSKNFFAYIKRFFKDYFSKDTQTIVSGDVNPDERQRYLANITFGQQKTYRLQKNSTEVATTVNMADNTKYVSLLEYQSQTVTEETGCSGLILDYDPSSLSCKVSKFFGMSKWMPFAESDGLVEIDTTSTLEDTETALLQLATNLNGIDYLGQKTKIDPITGERSFLANVFKPMTAMMSGMKRFFFGKKAKIKTQTVFLDFNFDTPVPLQFVTINSARIVVDFVRFNLLGTEAVYGTEASQCKVNKFSDPFVEGVERSETVYIGTKKSNFAWSNTDETVRNTNLIRNKYKTKKYYVYKKYYYNTTLNTQDWLDWCERNQGRQENHILKRILAKMVDFANNLFNKNLGFKTREDQIDYLLAKKGYTVDVYSQKVHKELILHLKKISTDDINIGTAGTTTNYKLMNIK